MSDIADALTWFAELERRRRRELDDGSLQRVRLLVAGHALDVDDLRSLLSMLGL